MFFGTNDTCAASRKSHKNHKESKCSNCIVLYHIWGHNLATQRTQHPNHPPLQNLRKHASGLNLLQRPILRKHASGLSLPERPILRTNTPGLRSFAFTSTSCTSLLKLLPRSLHRLSCSFRAYLGSNRRRKGYAKGCNQISSDPRHWTETYLFHHLSSSLLVFLASSPSGSSNISTMKLYKLGK